MLWSAGAWQNRNAEKLVPAAGLGRLGLEREVRPGRDGNQHLFLAINQCRRVVTGDLKSMAVRDRIRGAGFHAESAKNAAVVIDVINLGIPLAAADAERLGILGGLDVDALGRARGGAQKTGNTLLQAVLVPLQLVYAAITLLKFRRSLRIVFRERGIQHLAEGHRHSLGNGR